MSYADEARNAVVSETTRHYAVLRDAATAYGRANAQVAATSDLTQSLQAAIALTIAAEDLAEKADSAAKALRSKLATVMSETGATTIKGQFFSAHVTTKPKRVWVTDERMVPEEFIVHPPPKPDLIEIGKRLRAGDLVPGCSLTGNGEPTLAIKAKGAA